ncbi:hypothetical protein DWB68_06785 [Galactobacter valiniphilus]|uniref:Uncharacterized protein n=1 Tax=Galactobacter valiniphilus TaxID=2676122 RepID=A0A399JBM3_9MICC|nr:hypothetical protein [Galactobacter valiniphilus]RII42450.1 hypothetical protein DWB68_06785 [Galactobacter valiniphilus]
MRLIPRALVAAAAGLGLALSGVAPAVAAPAPSAVHVVTAIKAKPVTIKTIPTKTVSGAAKAEVKPSFAKAKGVSKVKAVITVKKGSKTVVKAKSSAKLAAGTYKVTTKVSYVYKGKKASVSKTQTLKVVKKAKKKPASVAATGWDCPSGYPIKGNGSSMIHHVPSGAFYDRTNPEECFASASAARAAGYRASQR